MVVLICSACNAIKNEIKWSVILKNKRFLFNFTTNTL